MRKILINEIIKLAGDEYESKEDWIELASKTDDELIHTLIGIANYYFNNH
mgnify:CR=1 FL=1